jgi:hypothetical protein
MRRSATRGEIIKYVICGGCRLAFKIIHKLCRWRRVHALIFLFNSGDPVRLLIMENMKHQTNTCIQRAAA